MKLTISTVTVAICLGNAGMGFASEQLDNASSTELAERVVELDGTRQFLQREWEWQMQSVDESAMEEMKSMMPEGYMDVMRGEYIDGRTEEWTNALAANLEPARLRAAVTLLESSAYREWLDAQLSAYGDFLEGLMTRSQATGEVMAEQMQGSPGDGESNALSSVEPVNNSAMAAALGFVPGAELEGEFGERYYDSAVRRAPGIIGEVFDDLSAKLTPTQGTARVESVSAQRAFATKAACERARETVLSRLRSHFPETETTDCGTEKYLTSDGDTTLTLRCQSQAAVDDVLLTMNATHQPTQDAAFGRFMATPTEDESTGQPGS